MLYACAHFRTPSTHSISQRRRTEHNSNGATKPGRVIRPSVTNPTASAIRKPIIPHFTNPFIIEQRRFYYKKKNEKSGMDARRAHTQDLVGAERRRRRAPWRAGGCRRRCPRISSAVLVLGELLPLPARLPVLAAGTSFSESSRAQRARTRAYTHACMDLRARNARTCRTGHVVSQLACSPGLCCAMRRVAAPLPCSITVTDCAVCLDSPNCACISCDTHEFNMCLFSTLSHSGRRSVTRHQTSPAKSIRVTRADASRWGTQR